MGTKRIIGLNATTDFESDDYIAVDGSTAGTRKMAQSVLKEKLRDSTLSDIHSLTPATDFATGDTIVVDNANGGPKGMDKDVLLAKTAQNALGSIHNLPTTITAFRTGDVIPVDGPSGTAKMPKEAILGLNAQEFRYALNEDCINLTDSFVWDVDHQITAGEDSPFYGSSFYTPDHSMEASDFLDVSGFSSLLIVFIVRQYTATAFSGLCFYDENKTVLPGEGLYIVDDTLAAGAGHSVWKLIHVPSNAKYVRTTRFTENSPLGSNTIPFACYAYGAANEKDIYERDNVDITDKFIFNLYHQIVAMKNDPNMNFGKSLATLDNSMDASNFVDVGSFDRISITCIVRQYTNTARSGIVFYDKDKNPLEGFFFTDAGINAGEGYSVQKVFDVPSGARYIRTTRFSSSSPLGSNTITFSCTASAINTRSNYNELKTLSEGGVDSIGHRFQFTQYYQVVAGQNAANRAYGKSISTPDNSMDASDYVDVSLYDELSIVCIVRQYTVTAFSGLCFYDKNKNVIEGHYYTDSNISAGEGYSALKTIKIPPTAKYVRTTRFSDNSPLGSNTLDFECNAHVKSFSKFDDFAEPNLVKRVLSYAEFTSTSVPNYPHHDTTYCESTEKVYAFNKPQDGNSKIYDKDFTFVKDIDVSFIETFKDSSTGYLEMKSVDCNHINNCLLVGNGKYTYKATDSYVYLFYDFLSWENVVGQINFSTCGNYLKYDFTELGVCVYAFWLGHSETNDMILVNTNFLKDYYFVRLGKGTTKLLKGSFIEGTTDPAIYNGTWEVVRHFTADNFMQINNEKVVWPHGGQYYKGALYIASDDPQVCEVFKVSFMQNGTAEGFAKIDTIVAENYIPSGTSSTKQYRFLDGMFIRDGWIYSAPLYVNGSYHSGSNKVVLKIGLNQ